MWQRKFVFWSCLFLSPVLHTSTRKQKHRLPSSSPILLRGRRILRGIKVLVDSLERDYFQDQLFLKLNCKLEWIWVHTVLSSWYFNMQKYKKLLGPSKNYNLPKGMLKVFFHEKKLVRDSRKTRDSFLPDVIVRLTRT